MRMEKSLSGRRFRRRGLGWSAGLAGGSGCGSCSRRAAPPHGGARDLGGPGTGVGGGGPGGGRGVGFFAGGGAWWRSLGPRVASGRADRFAARCEATVIPAELGE